MEQQLLQELESKVQLEELAAEKTCLDEVRCRMQSIKTMLGSNQVRTVEVRFLVQSSDE